MSIRNVAERPSRLSAVRRRRKIPLWCGSNIILAMMVALLAIVFAIKIRHG